MIPFKDLPPLPAGAAAISWAEGRAKGDRNPLLGRSMIDEEVQNKSEKRVVVSESDVDQDEVSGKARFLRLW